MEKLEGAAGMIGDGHGGVQLASGADLERPLGANFDALGRDCDLRKAAGPGRVAAGELQQADGEIDLVAELLVETPGDVSGPCREVDGDRKL